MQNAPAVAVYDLSKVFSSGPTQVTALERITFEAAPGEMVLLMGPSGSGKTTLLSILGCILRPTQGRVVVKGEETAGLPEKGLCRVRLRHIGFVFQNYNLFPTLRAVENVMVALDLKGAPKHAAREQSLAALAAVGLSDKAQVLPENLSGGQKQRLAIARALAGDPEIILADEPTAALDSSNGRNIMELLRTLATQRGRCVVIVTHDNRILEFGDRIVLIEDGKIKPK